MSLPKKMSDFEKREGGSNAVIEREEGITRAWRGEPRRWHRTFRETRVSCFLATKLNPDEETDGYLSTTFVLNLSKYCNQQANHRAFPSPED